MHLLGKRNSPQPSGLSFKSIVLLDVIFSLLALAFLFWLIYFQKSRGGSGYTYLPVLNASLNGVATVLLVFGYKAIRARQIAKHQLYMTGSLVVSALFLVSYVIYHHFQGDTSFTGQGFIRPTYFFILISHIVLSIFALPMVLYTYSMGITGRIDKHKQLAKWTFLIWLYVSVTGVLIFLFLKLFS